MDDLAKITNKEWSDMKSAVSSNSEAVGYLKTRTSRHSTEIDALENNHIALPLAIQEAVSKGMAPVLEKVLNHEQKFIELEIEKEREAKETALLQIQAERERKQWFWRSIVGTVIGATVGPAVTLIIFILINNA